MKIIWILTLSALAILSSEKEGRRSCKEDVYRIGKIAHGTVFITRNFKRIYIHCNKGYEPVGRQFLTCKRGRIIGNIPRCIDTCIMAIERQKKNGTLCGIQFPRSTGWPWMATIYTKDRFQTQRRNDDDTGHPTHKDKLVCGGTLITKEHVLTAASCFNMLLGKKAPNVLRYKVYLGMSKRDRIDANVQILNVLKVHIHPEVSLHYEENYNNDIAILKLSEPVKLNDFVRPICLPEKYTTAELIKDSSVMHFIGWGAQRSISKKLKNLKMPIVSDQICQKSDRSGKLFNRQTMFCAGDGQGKDGVCRGDGGGPISYFKLVMMGGRTCFQQWSIYGIASWGDSECGSGEVNIYDYFTRVTHFIDWIKQIIRN